MAIKEDVDPKMIAVLSIFHFFTAHTHLQIDENSFQFFFRTVSRDQRSRLTIYMQFMHRVKANVNRNA